jgi:hypothetical protein
MGSTSFSEVIFSIESVKNPLARPIYTAMKRKSTLQKLYHDVGASFIPTIPPSFTWLRLGKWLRKLMWKSIMPKLITAPFHINN